MAQGTLTEKLVVIGGSAGSLDALLKILPCVKSSFKPAIVLVLHRKAASDNILADLLSFKTPLPVKEIDDKDSILPGNVYIVPADYHVLFEADRTFALDDSEKINYSRPSIDVVFQSAAAVYGKHLVGILLSGANADGTEGMLSVMHHGGTPSRRTRQVQMWPICPNTP